jgi:carbon-monoxide dehydrogenase small subunit
MMKKRIITLEVNGEAIELLISPNRTLLDVLRNDLELTGTKRGCEEGACGVCTVLIDGQPFRSCLTLAVEAQGKSIETIEGLKQEEILHPVQEAFVSEGAVQCGFCTPGMVMTAKALLDENHNPTEEQIVAAISGNFCRCTGYYKIKKAIAKAAGENDAGKEDHGRVQNHWKIRNPR